MAFESKPMIAFDDEPKTVINQTNRHPIRTEKYSVVTTKDILSQLEESGLTWLKVAEENNTPKYKGFGTHLIRCSHPSFTLGLDENLKELTPQLYVKNSYHGRTLFEMHLGLFNYVSMKGFILGNKFETIKLKHIGLKQGDVEAAVDRIQERFTGEVAPFILGLKGMKVDESIQMKIAEAILKERVRSNANFVKGDHESLLAGLKRDSTGQASLWNIMETVKDNCGLEFRSSPANIRYELIGKDKDGNDVIKDRKISKLKNIQEITYMNKYLFDTVARYYLK